MNKPSFEVLQSFHQNSFLLRSFKEMAFTAPYHFHPEYELTLILKGKGMRFVNHNMEDYVSGDLVLLGSNLPHCWKTDDIIEGEINAHSIVIQFSKDFLGEHFFFKPEFSSIQELLQRSGNGIRFSEEIQHITKKRMIALVEEENNFKQLMSFLEILHDLSTTESFKLLSNDAINAQQSLADKQRINPVFTYIVENFKRSVSLNIAAEIANMTPNAFCRYFKKITRETFMETVISYRINYSVQQLVDTNQLVSQICFDSGFTDISHFYKLFKTKMKMSPLSYRKKFNKQI
ncbi:AraC family transcriptional regulator [Pedobacter sp. JCM 36344]|uniref:AraC family transcriptional regulator n=1 Tax=Pedobacter sp. JCM 36344 TaxID=3374280 RepID=UPI00397AC572